MTAVKKILYFHHGIQPTAEQQIEANSLGRGVRFRNADYIRPGDAIEECDYVAGQVPDMYRDKFPMAPKPGTPMEVPSEELSKEPPKPEEGDEGEEADEGEEEEVSAASKAKPKGKGKRSGTEWR